ncbi:apoptosis facilitator Bcl-2-like protein 14 isoform X2 [Denticeps clupeoides]|uniref:Apoptosis facilitator Bcl-2-like protein 14 n=1 Tax=Denticeps clupeoides TaxID=299321 RepID=A0AAY4CV21_9TELE|nr:apoptosis facilitator Bcl-2-like protein 14 isoform X2 [Denticeps clupeoides]
MTENGNAAQVDYLDFLSDAEYMIIVKYVRMRGLTYTGQVASKGDKPPSGSQSKTKKSKKTRNLLVKCLPSCICTHTSEPTKSKDCARQPASLENGLLEEDAGNVVAKLTKIKDTVPLLYPDEFECDSPDEIVDQIIQLLREEGDKLNEKIAKNKKLREELHKCFTYSLFKKVLDTIMGKLDFRSFQTNGSTEQAKIAMTCEVTSRLTAMDCHPMNRAMGFGSQYLKDNFSVWVSQHGGWNEAFADKREEEDEEVN